jgi:hypothetical protein
VRAPPPKPAASLFLDTTVPISADRPPLATLLTVALPLLLVAALLLRGQPPAVRHTRLAAAVLVGLLLTAASAVLWSRRHAGTGVETARGWPKPVHARWEDFEGRDRTAGIRWRGIAENTLVYASASLLLLAAAARRRVGRGAPPA